MLHSYQQDLGVTVALASPAEPVTRLWEFCLSDRWKEENPSVFTSFEIQSGAQSSVSERSGNDDVMLQITRIGT